MGFFNGVWNDETMAHSGLRALRSAVDRGHGVGGEPIRYELFYNRTGSQVGASSLQDLAEVFIQRSREIDTSGELERRWYLFWEAVATRSSSWMEQVRSAVQGGLGFADALYSSVMSTYVSVVSRTASAPPTLSDVLEHRARLETLALQGHRFLLVAHSQGNLLVNSAYDYLAREVSAGSARVLHVAPASPTLRDQYRLADIDLVIMGLRAHGWNSVPPSNLSLPGSLADLSGHQLVGTYLDPSRRGRAELVSLAHSAIDSLVTPDARAMMGLFSVGLHWSGSGDVDLHTLEPNGTHVHYASPTGTSGHLDYDEIEGYGPEYYLLSCDQARIQEGVYRFGINNYQGAQGTVASLQLTTSRAGVLATRSVEVGPDRGPDGNASPVPVLSVSVTRDRDGSLRAELQ